MGWRRKRLRDLEPLDRRCWYRNITCRQFFVVEAPPNFVSLYLHRFYHRYYKLRGKRLFLVVRRAGYQEAARQFRLGLLGYPDIPGHRQRAGRPPRIRKRPLTASSPDVPPPWMRTSDSPFASTASPSATSSRISRPPGATGPPSGSCSSLARCSPASSRSADAMPAGASTCAADGSYSESI